MDPAPIRLAGLDDLWQLRGLWTQLQAEERERGDNYPVPGRLDADTITQFLAAGLCETPSGLLVPVVELADRLVGFACGQVLTRPTGLPANYGFLLWIFVVPQHRRIGLGRQLLRFMAENFRRVPTLTHVQLVARANNDEWIRHGWTPITTEYVIEIPTWEARLAGNGHTESMDPTTTETSDDGELVQ